MKETESKAAQKKRKLSSEISTGIKTENEAKKRKETLLSPTSSLSPKKPSSVPPATTPVAPKMSSEEKNKDSFLILSL